jgi:hypothetical protein
MLKRTLVLTSPHEHGPDAKDAQYLLAGNNRFKDTGHPVRP